MDNYVLQINGITKKYKGITVLDNISMTIKKGQVYGLIGLNGAGKSTLIRAITGLAITDRGSIELFGQNGKQSLEKNRRRIGAVIETPALYDTKTVYENMYINRIQKGIPGEACIEKVLVTTGLCSLKDKKVKNLSLGSKQLLGIAMALLGEPEFLILDEPINALDPMRMVAVRELLTKLNVEFGVTMLISSHILGELYHIANCYGIIHKGRLIEELTVDKLKDKCKSFIHIKVDNAAKASVIINKKLNTSNFNVMPNNVIKLYDYIEEAYKVTEALVKEGIKVHQIMPMGEDLEAYFTRVIGGTENA